MKKRIGPEKCFKELLKCKDQAATIKAEINLDLNDWLFIYLDAGNRGTSIGEVISDALINDIGMSEIMNRVQNHEDNTEEEEASHE